MESDQQEKEEGKQQQNNEQSQEESIEEAEKNAGDGFSENVDININIQREKKNLDGANDRTISGDARTQHYLDSLLRGNDVNLQESLKQAIGDYFGQNRQYPDIDYNNMVGFVTDWLDLIDVPPSDLRNLMHMVRVLRENDVDDEFAGNEFGRNVDADIQTVIENLDAGEVVTEVESNDLPSSSEVGNGFGANLDGAEDQRDDEQVGDGFVGNLANNQDARDDLDEDFRDDPNFSIDVEELLQKWEEEETRRER